MPDRRWLSQGIVHAVTRRMSGDNNRLIRQRRYVILCTDVPVWHTQGSEVGEINCMACVAATTSRAR